MQRIFHVIATLLLFSTTISSQDFEVSPVLMSYNANPGEMQTKKIHIINHEAEPQTYTFTLSDYEITPDGQKKTLPAGTSKRSGADWVSINPSFVTLQPNESTDVEMHLTVPENGFSTRWGIVAVQAAKEQTTFDVDKTLKTGVQIVPRILILYKQQPRSSNNYRATIANLKEVNRPKNAHRTFQASIKNIGDNIIDGKVYLSLANMATAEEESFTPMNITVYPDSERTIELQLPKQVSGKNFVLAAILDYGHGTPLEGTQLLLETKGE